MFSSRAVLLAVVALTACGRDSRRVNLLVIGIDTLRADHLGCYGYPRPTSPRLDALSREGVLFTTAIAQSPWTLPSFASIFTGLLPSNHQAGEGTACATTSCVDLRGVRIVPLASTRATLATILHGAGYRTASFVSNSFAGRIVGLGEGFEETGESMSAEGAAHAAVSWLNARAREPFFLFLHIVDPHQPYEPPLRHAALFLDPGYQGPIGTSFIGIGREAPRPEDRRRVIDLYDGEVHYADSLVGRLLDALGTRGVADRTLVVVVADHGEELFERGGLGHGHSLHDELLHVPLIVRFPGASLRGRIDHQVRAMDVFPTVLEALDVPAPVEIDGVSLMPLVRGDAAPPETGWAIAENVYVLPDRKAVRQPDRKLVVNCATGQSTLFDLRTDPGEQRSVAAERPAEVAELRAHLDHALVVGRGAFHLQPGIHLLARGGSRSHRLRARLQTTGRFADLVPHDPERPAGYRVSRDGRVLDVRMTLAADGSADRDGIRFRIDGPQSLRVRYIRVDGNRLPPQRLRLGYGVGLPVAPTSLLAAPDLLRVPFSSFPPVAHDGGVSVALQSVERGAPPVVSLDEKTRANLRALGYVE